MLFNSLDFAIFLPIVFAVYWLIGSNNYRYQNGLILGASLFFYGWWDWRFLGLIVFSMVLDYTIGRYLETIHKPHQRKMLLYTSICMNLGLLGLFKYFNFFIENFTTVFAWFGNSISTSNLNIILPVGISFYTFQTLSYTIDVFNKKMAPEKSLIAFGAYVSFFPQLVAGPIERAARLLPQFHHKRRFEYPEAVEGLKQILWGLFKKVVIADNCAVYVNLIFDNPADYNGSTLIIGAILFAFQIYGDFSGYSDIAIGTARLFGFRLMQNFAFPYFSRDIAEFWRRWHISLSTWFRDYVYIPLGGSRGSTWMKIRNVFIIFLVSGFWHGANWTFIIWGGLNAMFFLPLLLSNKNRSHTDVVANGRIFPTVKEIFQISITFIITVFAWIFFRADSLEHALEFILKIFNKSILSLPNVGRVESLLLVITLVLFMIFVEWLGRENRYALEHHFIKRKYTRWLFYTFVIFLIGMYMESNETPFIYFQF